MILYRSTSINGLPLAIIVFKVLKIIMKDNELSESDSINFFNENIFIMKLVESLISLRNIVLIYHNTLQIEVVVILAKYIP